MKIVKYEEALQRFKDQVVGDRMHKEVAHEFGVSRVGIRTFTTLYEEEKTND